MNTLKQVNLILQATQYSSIKRYITTTSIREAGKIWRQKNGLPKLQTSLSSLINVPDYSFQDGRSVPLTSGQVERKELQESLCKEIIDGLKYLQRAKDAQEQRVAEIIEATKNSIETKLEPKGEALLKEESVVSKTRTIRRRK